MRVLVWQWGRRGAGPLFGAGIAEGLAALPGVEAVLSLSKQAEIMHGPAPPDCVLPVTTYRGMAGFALRAALAPIAIGPLARRIKALRVDVAVCAMPGLLDLLMAAALRRAGVRFAVVVHDADYHPGDGLPFQMKLQRQLIRRAGAVIVLSEHVAETLRAQGALGEKPVVRTRHPVFRFGALGDPPGHHGGKLRLLFFGRLLPYKGLDLLADALARVPNPEWEVRVVGSGPETPALERLRTLLGVTVENRWVADAEIGALLAWSDAVVLPNTEASQSGVAASAIAARRWIIATNVGGLREQLRDEPMARLSEPGAENFARALQTLLTELPPITDGMHQPSWQTFAEDILLVLRTLAGRSRVSP
jgi:glycosyltransferase involved in cell wall biosynthesis